MTDKMIMDVIEDVLYLVTSENDVPGHPMIPLICGRAAYIVPEWMLEKMNSKTVFGVLTGLEFKRGE